MTLNHAQLLAVESDTPRTVVVAGPGSGKTRVIVERIVHRYGRNSAPNIVILTFTNNAAREIVARLARHGITPLFAGTLHGYCFRLLQKHGHLLGYRKGAGLAIVTEEARAMLLDETKAKLGYTKLSAKAIEAGESAQAKAVLAEYRHSLKRQNMIDFDLILERAKDLLIGGKLAPVAIAELYVDEAQDSGELDWIIYRAIHAPTKFYVGDFDQSLYRFRGADPNQFLLQAAIRENSQTLTLERNYRSDVRICAAANAMIANNTNRIAKVINPESGLEGHLEIVEVEASRQEAITIAGRLRDWKADGLPFEEMAVLARTNAIADEIRATLREMMVPVADSGRSTLPADWSLCLTVLQLMIEPANNIFAELYLKEKMLPAATVNRFKMDALKSGKAMHTLAPAEFEWLRGGHPLSRQLTIAGVSRESVELVVERMSALPECSQMSDLLSDLWDTETWRPPATVAGVTVSTIHKAKGREWDAVVIAGCEEGVLPSLSKQADIEEERRMMFVALTRARHRVLISHCRQRFAYGKRADQQPSRFIVEMNL